ncbi:BBE domain-containing protein [Nocardiopsis coralli]|uniref:BBE domain-containing protein n=1 Tax=Nocardiopsis coralli TaxID=2772213 RepID=UPI0038B3FAF0
MRSRTALTCSTASDTGSPRHGSGRTPVSLPLLGGGHPGPSGASGGPRGAQPRARPVPYWRSPPTPTARPASPWRRWVGGPQEAFPEPTLRRLRELKAKYDPHHVFDQNFMIPPGA